MHFSKIAPVAGLLATASLVAAAPLEQRSAITYGDRSAHVKAYNNGAHDPPSSGSGSSSGGAWTDVGGSTATATTAGPAGSSTGTTDGSKNPFSFPLSNGFPNVAAGSSQLNSIQDQGRGTLPNGPPPSSAPAADDVTSLRLIAFNEIFEVAYFTQLLYNVTNNVHGYEVADAKERTKLIATLTAIQAQEEIHAINTNNALAAFNAGPIQPCSYIAPVSNLNDAIELASTFTDVVLGTLADVQTKFGLNGDSGLIRGLAAVLGQEGEQDGYFRSFLGQVPSSTPFLTASTREFAFSALNQNFIVPNSCPNINTIGLPIFGTLNLLTQNIKAQDQTLQFSWADKDKSGSNPAKEYSMVYINQQNTPVVVSLDNATSKDGVITASAQFPFSATKMFGLTIAAITNSAGPFASVTDVAKATVFGPALIEI